MNVVKGFFSRLRGLLTAALVLLLALQLSLGLRPLQPGRLADGMLEIVLCSQGSMRTVLLNLETGEVVPTDGRNRKPKNKVGDEPDYKALYEKLLKKCVSQEELIKLLKAKLAKFEKEV